MDLLGRGFLSLPLAFASSARMSHTLEYTGEEARGVCDCWLYYPEIGCLLASREKLATGGFYKIDDLILDLTLLVQTRVPSENPFSVQDKT